MQRKCGNCIYWSPKHAEHARCKKCGEGRNNFVPRDMPCPAPNCQSGMIYYASDEYLECPDCGTQVWPFVMEKSDKDVIRQEFEKHLDCARSKQVGEVLIHVKGQVKGGSKSKKGRNKQSLQKPSQTQIYKGLAASSNDNHNKELARKRKKDIAK